MKKTPRGIRRNYVGKWLGEYRNVVGKILKSCWEDVGKMFGNCRKTTAFESFAKLSYTLYG
jgi:hypothetical protein